jgi:hypothetical protein
MRITKALAALTLGLFCLPLHAGLSITVQDEGELVRQYFDNGRFLLVQSGRPAFGIDGRGHCWFVQGANLVSDPCETMLGAAVDMQDQALSGLGERERAMMAQMMGGAGPAPVPRRTGEITLAGYSAECYAIGDSREVCVSPRLLAEIMREMGDGPFSAVSRQYRQNRFGPGGDDPAAELFERGFPVRDMQRAAAIPGFDPAMLGFLPEAQRAQLMQQLGGAGPGGMNGSEVVSVERNVSMPAVDLSGYRKVGFAEFMRESFAGMGRPR